MHDSIYTIYIILGIIVFALAIYLGVLLNKLRLQKEMIKKYEEDYSNELEKRETFIIESLAILARAIVNEQCDISEGTIRIKNLKDNIDYLAGRVELKPFDEFYEKIKGFAILEERQKLSKQDRFNEDKVRFKIENDYQDVIKFASNDLLLILKEKETQKNALTH